MKQTVVLLLISLVGVALPKLVTANSTADKGLPITTQSVHLSVVTEQYAPNIGVSSVMPNCGSGEFGGERVAEWLSQWSCGTLALSLAPTATTEPMVSVQNIHTPNIVVVRTQEIIAPNNVAKNSSEQPLKFAAFFRNNEDFTFHEVNSQEFYIDFTMQTSLSHSDAKRYFEVLYALLC